MRFFLLLSTLLISLQSHAKLEDGLYANLHTNQGDIIIKLAFEKTPLTVINFVGLAEGTKHSNIQIGKPFYNGLKFHRVIDNFMIQGGDPKGNGTGGPGYKFIDEITDLTHDTGGILSMANSGPNTNGSQFFITHEATPWLDGKHTVFGHVVKGMSVVNTIKKDDFIRKVFIERIGDKAKKFKTDEAAFEAYNQKNLVKEKAKQTKKKQKLINFVKVNYPDAKVATEGHYVQINQTGNGETPELGDLVKVNLSIDLDDGTNMRKADEPLPFAAGSGTIIKVIDQSALTMNIGEKRTIIASYAQIYGDSDRGSLPQESLLIFNLELLSINEID
ncbi:MAG: peptidylprolyl isomerase [Candidatus Thioglobus sp.]|jgi:peptidylprolyl isomerase|uniref:peptidylprolyl isomerase n=1 Tax=Candidatus Thioglobus sp. TaxID=2026721 RepID=UPI001DE78CE2|nr:peptidylprolyl isomerase [Candidatus Thioglobus sp.]MBT3186272.1 peptidylprolyl isomerase [Candidatus Thioglobus sp.]MBT4923037.1 peptidylprolyl isomerase [Candidatus Thioglobus sp.]MBT6655233.1 peptidylprolyl isomerase [Candidatus Thioglobus sp.]MBT7002814.1 peptidylprolyl isomerase [Candidatus Thioglobus sp.]MBT7412441.1 peptidylprolyl isomerase [Candidatus Thioglobus sp.]